MESLPRLPWDFSSIVRGWYDDSAPLQLCVVGVGPVALSEALSGVSLLQAMPRVDPVDIGASLLWDAKASLQAVESPLEVARPKPLSLLAERIEPSVKRRKMRAPSELTAPEVQVPRDPGPPAKRRRLGAQRQEGKTVNKLGLRSGCLIGNLNRKLTAVKLRCAHGMGG
ncbi:unnamed protein product [Effrenium voratum]|nr:unnamed protein product [Effrenium voratum]